MKKVMLCVDGESARYPQTLGLAGESFAAQEWLQLVSKAEEARAWLRSHAGVREIWVASCEDMEPVNLAACLKRDDSSCEVYLLEEQRSGSLMSRTKAAGLDGALSHQAFAGRYAQAKKVAAAEASRAGDAGRGLSGEGKSADSSAQAQPRLREQGVPREAGAMRSQAAPLPQAAPQPQGASPRPAQSAFLLSVVSGSGGAGKSAVAAMAAVIAQVRGLRTLVCDFDFQFGDMRTMLDLPQAPSVDEVLTNPLLINRVEPDGRKPALLAAPPRIEQAEELAKEVPRLLDLVSGRFDVVVANTGASWGEQHAALLERSSKALFLVDQRSSSLRACRHAFELCARCGIAASPFLFVANRCKKAPKFSSMDVSCALHGAPAVELSEGGPEVEDLLSAGMPIELLATRNEFCLSLADVLDGILPQGGQAGREAIEALPGEPRGFFARLKARRKEAASWD